MYNKNLKAKKILNYFTKNCKKYLLISMLINKLSNNIFS